MKVLFVYRAYGTDLLNSVIDFQINSLPNDKIEVEKFPISSGGLRGYWNAAIKLKKRIVESHCDVVHAHYSYSGFISRMVSNKPVVCSLMGSDLLQQNILLALTTKFFYSILWNKTIVKSVEMLKKLPKAERIPNGVNFKNFREIPKEEAAFKVGFNPGKKNIIFVAQDPQSKVKNFQLAEKSLELLNDNNIECHIVSNIEFSELPYYYSAADILLLTSLSEGSPNVIKEAMACNTPIVSVDVGDVKEIIGDTSGTYLCSFDPSEIAQKIKSALNFGKRTNGREKISHLNSNMIADQLILLYNKILAADE